MKRKVFIAILISFIVGVLIQIYIGDFRNEPDIANKMASLAGGGIGFLIAVIILPLIISLIITAKNKKFPNDTFTTITYIVLVILALIMFIGQWNLKSMASTQQVRIEKLRNELKAECLKVTASVYDIVETSEKNELTKRSREYCECLYNKVARNDLKRIIEKEILLPELLNLEYKQEQDDCFQQSFQGLNVTNMSDQMETDDEKRAFWSGRLVSYYLMTYGDFKSEYVTKVLDCFTPIFDKNFSNKISDWENRELSATEIFDETPIIKDKIEECYNNLE